MISVQTTNFAVTQSEKPTCTGRSWRISSSRLGLTCTPPSVTELLPRSHNHPQIQHTDFWSSPLTSQALSNISTPSFFSETLFSRRSYDTLVLLRHVRACASTLWRHNRFVVSLVGLWSRPPTRPSCHMKDVKEVKTKRTGKLRHVLDVLENLRFHFTENVPKVLRPH